MHDKKYSIRTDRRSYWKGQVESYYSTNLNQKAYCRQNNLSYWSFNMWKRRIDKESNSNGLTEVPGRKIKELSQTGGSFEISLNNRIKISIPDNFNPEVLKKVLITLGIEI